MSISSPRRESDVVRDNIQRLVDQLHDGSVLRAADRLGMPHMTLVKILKGQTRQPRQQTIERIAQSFGVSLEYLLTDHGAPLAGYGNSKLTGDELDRYVMEGRMLLASALNDLRLPADVVDAFLGLSFVLDECAVALGATVTPAEDDGADQYRVDQALGFFMFLRRAIAAHGAERVREAVLERADDIRFRFSPILPALEKTGAVSAREIANAAKLVNSEPPFYVRYQQGTPTRRTPAAHEPAPPAKPSGKKRRQKPRKKKSR